MASHEKMSGNAPPPGDRRIHSSQVSLPRSVETMTSYVGVTLPTSAEPPASSSPSLCQVLSSTQTPAAPSSTLGADSIVSINGRYYRQCNAALISYNLSNHVSSSVLSCLIDGGANGGMAGDDVRTLSELSFNQANVTGILGDSMIQNLSLGTVAGLVTTHRGPAIVILHQYANYGNGHTIHSSSQLRAFGTLVHDLPRRNGGLQRLITPDGYHIPLSYRSGLPYMDMRPPNDAEMDSLPHILLTGDDIWNPSSLDDEFSIADLLLLDAPPDSTGDPLGYFADVALKLEQIMDTQELDEYFWLDFSKKNYKTVADVNVRSSKGWNMVTDLERLWQPNAHMVKDESIEFTKAGTTRYNARVEKMTQEVDLFNPTEGIKISEQKTPAVSDQAATVVPMDLASVGGFQMSPLLALMFISGGQYQDDAKAAAVEKKKNAQTEKEKEKIDHNKYPFLACLQCQPTVNQRNIQETRVQEISKSLYADIESKGFQQDYCLTPYIIKPSPMVKLLRPTSK
jgi:hypothetical protein